MEIDQIKAQKRYILQFYHLGRRAEGVWTEYRIGNFVFFHLSIILSNIPDQ